MTSCTRDKQVAFLGVGRMAEAIITQLVASETLPSSGIIGTHHSAEIVSDLRQRVTVDIVVSNREATERASIVVVSVRPQQVRAVLEEVGAALSKDQILVTLAPGIPIAWYRKRACNVRHVFHVHPSSLVFADVRGVSFVCGEAHADDESLEMVGAAFRAIGEVIPVKESLLPACAVFAGAGPAFFAQLAALWRSEAVEAGIPGNLAQTFVKHLFFGLGDAGVRGHLDLDSLVEKIATPKGVTETGLTEMSRLDIVSSLKGIADSCIRRIEGISRQYGD